MPIGLMIEAGLIEIRGHRFEVEFDCEVKLSSIAEYPEILERLSPIL